METAGFVEGESVAIAEETIPSGEALPVVLHALTQSLCLTGESVVTTPVLPDIDEQILRGYCQF